MTDAGPGRSALPALATLPTHLRRRLEAALETGLLSASSPLVAIRSVAGPSDGVAEDVQSALRELADMGIEGPVAAAWIRTVVRVSSRNPFPDLVWSGPEVPGLHTRDTRRVYEELLGSAERSLWASTYAFFDGPRAFAVLARRMEERPGLRVRLLLNIQRDHRDKTAPDSLVRRFADRFWGAEWPGPALPAVYYDPRSLDPGGPGGVLHAKAVVADDQAVFVTSANLTEAALDRNIELGLLVRDHALAQAVSHRFQELIDRGLLVRLPD